MHIDQLVANMYEINPNNICQNNLANKNKNKKGMLFKREYAGSPSIVFLVG